MGDHPSAKLRWIKIFIKGVPGCHGKAGNIGWIIGYKFAPVWCSDHNSICEITRRFHDFQHPVIHTRIHGIVGTADQDRFHDHEVRLHFVEFQHTFDIKRMNAHIFGRIKSGSTLDQ